MYSYFTYKNIHYLKINNITQILLDKKTCIIKIKILIMLRIIFVLSSLFF